MIVVAPVAMKFALGENPKNVYHGKNQTPETRMATASIIREYLQKAKKYDEAWNKYHAALDKYNLELEKARQTGDDGPDEPAEPDFDAKSEALLPVNPRRASRPFRMPIAQTTYSPPSASHASSDCVSIIVHCTDGASIADILAAEGVTAFTGPNLSDRSKPELRSLSFENPGILDRAGVLVGITTDHPVIPLQYLPLCAALAVRAGMDRGRAARHHFISREDTRHRPPRRLA